MLASQGAVRDLLPWCMCVNSPSTSAFVPCVDKDAFVPCVDKDASVP
jgi:hypothetical protein